MTKKFIFTFSIFHLALLISCGDKKSITEPHSTPPDVVSLFITPDSINFDSLTLNSNSEAPINISVSAATSVSNPYRVSASLLVSETGEELASIDLAREAIPLPPLVYYKGTISKKFKRTDIGKFTIAANSFDEYGQSGANAKTSIRIYASNSAPKLISVTSPDTVVIPSTGDYIFKILATASDSDGVTTISKITATRSDNKFTFDLLDNGDVSGLSGDLIAGDGTFTATLRVPSTNSPNMRIFIYQAIDKQGALSNTISKTIHFVR